MDVQTLGASARRRIVDSENPDSVASAFRRRRWTRLLDRFPDLAEMRVLDLGGTVQHWTTSPVMPASLTVLNLMGQEAPDERVDVQIGDACDPPSCVRSETYDLVYSNSVLEHVGGHARRQQMADVVAASGERHWVQTPNRYFPLEPHWLFPGFQFLPISARIWVTEHWPLGYIRGVGRAAVEQVLSTELVGSREMSFLFPDSELQSERALGLTKSLIAVR